ncbi:mevalonate kinase [Desulfurococcaceae archaeon MEX13E-LK6-19]|nr:mevalonate kinase [Desulfurococcaceae archaeon MEX13E-LK6-19]
MRVCARAPAKTILFGEHFVVLGRPALVAAINIYAKVCIEDNDKLVVESKNLGLRLTEDNVPEQLKPYQIIINELVQDKSKKCFHALIESDIPVGAGMGSSAATSVAFTAALAKFLGLELSLDEISRIAFKAEQFVHGKPSGIDNTISTYGGILYYKKGMFKRISISWPEDYYLVLADTGVERSTKDAVKKVLDRYNRRKTVMEHIYNAAEEIVDAALKALKEKDMDTLGELMNINHGLLVSIGVAIPETELIVHNSLKAGAIGAKITGAGMGGSVLLLVRNDNLENVIKHLSNYAKATYVSKPVDKGVEVYIAE